MFQHVSNHIYSVPGELSGKLSSPYGTSETWPYKNLFSIIFALALCEFHHFINRYFYTFGFLVAHLFVVFSRRLIVKEKNLRENTARSRSASIADYSIQKH